MRHNRALFHLLRACSLITAVLLTSVTRGQEKPTDVKQALAEHEEALAESKQDLDEEFRKAIKVAANAEQLAELRALLDAREDFLVNGDLPSMPAMTDAVKKYTDARKDAALKVVAAYRTAMEAAAKRLMLDEAQARKREMNGFINSERLAIGLPIDETLEEPPAASEVEEGKTPPATGPILEEFLASMQTELERLSRLETSAIREAEHRKLIERLDSQLSRYTLVFHFPIDDVKEGRGGTYDLNLGDPPELKNIRYKHRIGSIRNVKLKPAEALSIGSTHAYEVRGKGRLGYDTYEPNEIPRAFKTFVFNSPHSQYTYAIYVWSYKTDIKTYDASAFSPGSKGPTDK